MFTFIDRCTRKKKKGPKSPLLFKSIFRDQLFHDDISDESDTDERDHKSRRPYSIGLFLNFGIRCRLFCDRWFRNFLIRSKLGGDDDLLLTS